MNDNNEEYQAGDNAAEEETAVAVGPGIYLREAREAQHLTQQQVAAELRMQVRTIEALEADDYQSLPGTTFVQGYLRSYARLLGLDETAIVAMGQQSSVAGETELRSVYETSEQMSSSDMPVRMVSYLVVLAAVVGLAWWLAQKIPSGDGETTQPLAGSSSTEHALPLQAQADGAQLQQENLEIAGNAVGGEAVIEGSPEEAVASETPAGDEGSSTMATASQATPTETAQPAGEMPAEDTAVSGSAAPEPNDSSLVMPSAVSADAPPPLSDDMPQSRIELEYQADSWTEISDAAGRQLVYSLVPAGRNLVLRGEAPFKVFLGYAPGVNVYFNGDLYDHGPYQRGDVARFRIGRAEHNRPLTGN